MTRPRRHRGTGLRRRWATGFLATALAPLLNCNPAPWSPPGGSEQGEGAEAPIPFTAGAAGSACCLGGGCLHRDETTCAALGGEFLGAGSDCSMCPSSPVDTRTGETWADEAEVAGGCCVDNGCLVLSKSSCAAARGIFLGADIPCTDCTAPRAESLLNLDLVDSDDDGCTDLFEIQIGTDRHDPTDCPDIDGDGIPNEDDNDVDGDHIPNADDPDVDGDGIDNDDDDDIDADGVANDDDDDDDGDGVPDEEDDDDDGDGVPDDKDEDAASDCEDHGDCADDEFCDTAVSSFSKGTCRGFCDNGNAEESCRESETCNEFQECRQKCLNNNGCEGGQVCHTDSGRCLCNNDNGCRHGYKCNKSQGVCERDLGCAGNSDCIGDEICLSGTCVELDRCNRNADCAPGLTCEKRNGRCRRAQCAGSDDDCRAYEQCNPFSNRCDPRGSCDADLECRPDEKCNTTSNRCERKVGCDASGDSRECDLDESCSEDGQCEPNDECDAQNPMCPANQICETARGRCERAAACVDDSECMADMVCDPARGRCESPTVCSDDDDCEDDEVCRNDQCKPSISCQGDDACDEGEECRNGKCELELLGLP